MLHHPYYISTFKTNALCLASNEGQVKHLLLLYKWLINAITGDAFAVFHSYDTPTFKTIAFCLVSNEGWVKHLLLLYKQII